MNYRKMLWHRCNGGDESTRIEQKAKGFFCAKKCLFWGRELKNGGSVTQSMRFTLGQSFAYILIAVVRDCVPGEGCSV